MSILSASGGGVSLAFGDADELAALAPALAGGLYDMALHPERLGTVDSVAYAPFEARNIARRFSDIFDRLATGAAA